MREIPESALSDRERKRLGNARVAMDRGNFEYVMEICGQLLRERPECLDVRRLRRNAQKRVYAKRTKKGAIQAMLSGWGVAVFGRLQMLKKPEESMAMAERVLDLDPYQPRALSLLAHAARRLELWETDAFCLESICDRYPDNQAKLQRYCEALIKVGDTEEALAVAERLLRLKPSNIKAQELLKSASVAHSISQGKWAEQKKDFRSKLRDRSKSEALEFAHRMAVDSESGKLALESLVEEMHEDPQNLDTYKRAIRLCIEAEDYDAALAWMEKAAPLPGADYDITFNQLRSDLKVAQFEQELERLERDPSENEQRIAELNRELKETRIAETTKLVEQFPNDYSLRFKYGEQLLDAGNLDTAIRQFQIAQRSPSLKLRALQLLGRSFMDKGLYDLALEQLERANESLTVMDDAKKETLYLMGECCEEIGETEKAMAYFKSIYASDIAYRDVSDRIDAFYKDS